MSTLQNVVENYKQCIIMHMNILANKWIVLDNKSSEIHHNCVNLAISLQDSIEQCKHHDTWQEAQECWEKKVRP